MNQGHQDGGLFASIDFTEEKHLKNNGKEPASPNNMFAVRIAHPNAFGTLQVPKRLYSLTKHPPANKTNPEISLMPYFK